MPAGREEMRTLRRIVSTFLPVLLGDLGSSSPLRHLDRVDVSAVVTIGDSHASLAIVGELSEEPIVHGAHVITALGGEYLLLISNAAGAQAFFPKGVLVAIKQPREMRKRGLNAPVLVVKSVLGVEVLGLGPSLAGHRDLRQRGNDMFKKKEFQLAKAYYSASMDEALASGDVPAYLLSCSNRAIACLRLNQLEETIATCDLALGWDSQHVKSLYQKGLALCALDQHDQALACFTKAVDPSSVSTTTTMGDQEVACFRRARDECVKHCRQSNGDFVDELERVYSAGLQPPLTPTKFASFVSPAVSRSTGGLIVNVDVDAGELLLACNPVDMSDPAVTWGSPSVDTILRILLACNRSPRLVRQLESLDGPGLDMWLPNSGDRFQEAIQPVDHSVNLDSIATRVRRESVTISLENIAGEQLEVSDNLYWPIYALIKQSCVENVSIFNVSNTNTLFVRASKNLKAGEHLQRCKVNVFEHLRKRKQWLEQAHVSCSCPRCQLEERLAPVLEPAWSSSDCVALERALNGLTLSADEKAWIRAGFITEYVLNQECDPLDAIMAIHRTAPGRTMCTLLTVCEMSRRAASAVGAAAVEVETIVREEFMAQCGHISPAARSKLLAIPPGQFV